jgi:hypothetical protein
VLSLLPGNQNQAAYETAGFAFHNRAIEEELEPEDAADVFAALDAALEVDGTSLLVHRDLIDDQVVGLLGGYLVHAGLVRDPIVATSVIQEIIGRAIGPEGRKLIPTIS